MAQRIVRSSRRRRQTRLAPLRLAQMALAACTVAGCAGLSVTEDPAWDSVPEEMRAERPPADGAIFQAGYDVPLFENNIAHRVGDILTIRLVETTTASKDARTSTRKSTSLELPGPTIAGRPVTANGVPILETEVNNASEFDGEGSSSQSNRLFGDVTVTIVERFGNGNLRVRGEKWLTINQGRELVRLSGIVRRTDIQPDNTVASTRVANASIGYSGRGALAESNAPGWFARFFSSPLMPF
jgi:flagellar L-ring protein precursor FlgH